MPFSESVQKSINEYIERYTGDGSFYSEYFWFISDEDLRTRLEEEFKSARYVYKLLEGMQARDWLLTAEVRIQILLYASIYEAVLHHVLLQDYATTDPVKRITTYEARKKINISGAIKQKIVDTYAPTGEIAVYQLESAAIDERKIVFEEKAAAALELGLIDQSIYEVIVKVYSLRNAIHLHAELRRNIAYEIKAARDAYWHLQGFCRRIADRMVRDGKATRAPKLSESPGI
ncbi:hypothetical protein [Ottowia sp. VDI28]|uniref:hypothetical protein n=1 Tax=Ottowia sp. VDI28 TaxID=3133968 RepID=UPI003C2FD147